MKERSLKFIGAILLLAFFISQPLAAQEKDSAATNRHLVGKEGVVELLKAKGLKVTQL